jgi:hypothetical protein
MYSLAATSAPALSPATVAAIAALTKLPCWSDQAHACVDTTGASTLPNCAAIRAGYASGSAADKAAMDAAVDAMPFCPAPGGDWMMLVGVGALGLALGLVIGTASK